MVKDFKKLGYDDLSDNEKIIAEGLINKANDLENEIDKLYKDVEEFGATEMFTQSEKTPPYSRERPEYKLWLASLDRYQKICKQISDLLKVDVSEVNEGDELLEFIAKK